jgi:dolichol-phosphate mannosyltransferase
VKLSLIIPAFNESESVSHTVEKLAPTLSTLRQKYEVEVVFIDDGSRDQTYNLLKEAYSHDANVRVVTHGINKGPGAAVRTGFAESSGDIIVSTDFDGTYAFSTIPDLVELLLRESADIVTASPYHPKGGVEGVPRYRLLFSQGASLLYRVLVSRKIHTWTAMYRAYRRPVVEKIKFESDGFLGGTQLLVYALRAGYKVIEYPTVLHRRSFGQSSLKIARTTRTHLEFLWRILWTRN